MWRRCLLALTGAWGMGLAIAPVMAQPLPKQAIFENLQLRPNFAPNPQLLRGVSGEVNPPQNFWASRIPPRGLVLALSITMPTIASAS